MLAKPKSPLSYDKSPPTNSYASTNETLLYAPVDFLQNSDEISASAFFDATHNQKYPSSTDAYELSQLPVGETVVELTL